MNSDQYIAKVFTTLATNPTASELDFLVEAFTRIGYLSAEAESLAEEAEAKRKNEMANAYLEAKRATDPKVSDRQAEAMAEVNTWSFRTAEATAKTKARKLKNLLESIEQAINAIKFLGRYDSSSVSVPR